MAAIASRRTAAALFLVAACASLASLPGAVAQGTQPLIQVEITGTPANQVVQKVNGVLSYTFTVSFNCASGTERGDCTGQVGSTQVDVFITEARKASYPAGWTVKVEPLSMRIAASETETVAVTVTLLEEEPAESRFTIELRADARPIVESPVGGGLGDILNDQLAQSSSASDTVEAGEEVTFSERVVGVGRRYMWPLLGAAAVLMLAGVILIERRRGSLEVTCEQPSQDVLPGRGVSFPVRIRNRTREDHRFALRVSELPPGWTTILPLDEIDLRANDETQFYLSVKAPPTASPGQAVRGELRARAVRGASLEESTDFTVTVAPDPYAAAAFSPPPEPAAPTAPAAAPAYEPPPPEPLEPDDLLVLDEEAPAAPPKRAAAKRKPKKGGAKKR